MSSPIETDLQQCLVTITPSPQFSAVGEATPQLHPSSNLLTSATCASASESVSKVSSSQTLASSAMFAAVLSGSENFQTNFNLPSISDDVKLKEIAKLAASGPKVRNRRGHYEYILWQGLSDMDRPILPHASSFWEVEARLRYLR